MAQETTINYYCQILKVLADYFNPLMNFKIYDFLPQKCLMYSAIWLFFYDFGNRQNPPLPPPRLAFFTSFSNNKAKTFFKKIWDKIYTKRSKFFSRRTTSMSVLILNSRLFSRLLFYDYFYQPNKKKHCD